MDKYASTVADLMTEMGLEGWDFIGAEALKERRRRFLILVCDIERTLMIFRRPARLHDLGSDQPAADDAAELAPIGPVQPRRVKRPDLIAEVAAGARRIPVTTVQRPDTPENPTGDPTAAASDDDGPKGKAHMLERAVKSTKSAARVAAE